MEPRFPRGAGLATVHDRDILIYCISQIVRALNDDCPVSRTVRFQAAELLRATNRMTTGRGYDLLQSALERLAGTTISTNIITGGQESFDVFGLVESARVVREIRDRRMQEIEVVLSEWIFRAIRAYEVLTLSRDYFQLRKPLERRLYEIARKHCSAQREWNVSLGMLQHEYGSNSRDRKFRELFFAIVREDERYGHFPDYDIRMSSCR